jgi:GntR family transcriptional repressor for pyruvate dehydrogenase complex
VVARTKLPAARSGPGHADGDASFRPVPRVHAADPIFEQLASAILRGDLTPGDPLPPERVLAEQFGVSRIVLRQAVHRLADAQLVRVRQGGATVILDPAEAGDLRVLALYYLLDPGGDAAKAIRRDAIEKQFLQGLSLIDVCGRRASLEERRSLVEFAAAIDDRHAGEADFAAFEETFWRSVARAGKNRIFGMEVAWWYGTLGESRPSVAEAKTDAAPSSIAVRIAFYRELARRLVGGESATAYYLAVASPQLDALFAHESSR